MKRVATRAIIFFDDNIALMYREKPDRIYYTLSGGGLEEDELLTEGVIREVYEEFGIKVKPVKLCYVDSDDKSITYYFLCEYVSGEFGSGEGEEFGPDKGYGLYLPKLIKISDLESIPLVPNDLKEILLKDIANFGKILDDRIKNLK